MSAAGVAIRARGLSKIYRVYHNPLAPLLDAVSGGRRFTERVALDNIDLELRRGEIVGVLGRNGAGKSTLLKIISGTLDRTAGELEVNGRITAILELGTGFHPEYSGRDNIYMGGLCLGMTRAEIDAKIDSVIEFSELREVIDQPFKTYSTGMQARLTFATAISVDPDILIVDEALSVGDARFQMKCFSWIERLRAGGATVLLVSHDTNTITAVCDRALILENGCIVSEGDPLGIVTKYHRLLFGVEPPKSAAGAGSDAPPPAVVAPPAAPVAPAVEVVGDSAATGEEYGNGQARLVDGGLIDVRGVPLSVVRSGSRCRFFMEFEAQTRLTNYAPGFAIRDRRGTVLFGLTSVTQKVDMPDLSSGERLSFDCDLTVWLSDGDYSITYGVGHAETAEKIAFRDPGLWFKVVGPAGIFTTSVVNLQTDVKVRKL